MSGTPLLLLTADRPPELRDCSSGQTIDQLKLYGDYVRHFVELAIPEADAAMLAYLRQTAGQTVLVVLNFKNRATTLESIPAEKWRLLHSTSRDSLPECLRACPSRIPLPGLRGRS